MIKQDITNVEDVRLMVYSFYEKVNADELLSPIFNDVANIDWDIHLPKMVNFWSKILLGVGDYNGQPFPPHIPLPIDSTYFQQWLKLFENNINYLFVGEKAEEAKLRAKSIAHIFVNKLEMIRG